MIIGKKIEATEEELKAVENFKLTFDIEESKEQLLGQIGNDIEEYNTMLDDYNEVKNQRVKHFISNELNTLFSRISLNRDKISVM